MKHIWIVGIIIVMFNSGCMSHMNHQSIKKEYQQYKEKHGIAQRERNLALIDKYLDELEAIDSPIPKFQADFEFESINIFSGIKRGTKSYIRTYRFAPIKSTFNLLIDLVLVGVIVDAVMYDDDRTPPAEGEIHYYDPRY